MTKPIEFSSIPTSPELLSPAEFSKELDRAMLEDISPDVIESYRANETKNPRKMIDVGKKAVAGFLAAGAIVGGGLMAQEGLKEEVPAGTWEVQVQPGDTLWSIYRQVYGDEVDIRKHLRGVDANIMPGQVVTLTDVPQERLELLQNQPEASE